jgi:Family of unknown function (DUF5989)
MLDFASELWKFLRVRKKFWLMPVIVILCGIGGEETIPADGAHYTDSVHFTDAGSVAMAHRVGAALPLVGGFSGPGCKLDWAVRSGEVVASRRCLLDPKNGNKWSE